MSFLYFANMKSSKNILDFFKVEHITLLCPACGISVPKSRLNFHLDSDCSSSVQSDGKCNGELEKSYLGSSKQFTSQISTKSKSADAEKYGISKSSSKNRTKRNRLSLKHQRIDTLKKSLGNEINFSHDSKCVIETEIITLEDDSSSESNFRIENHVNKEPTSKDTPPFKLRAKKPVGVINLDGKSLIDADAKREENSTLTDTDVKEFPSVTKAHEIMSESVPCEISEKISVDNTYPSSETYSSTREKKNFRDETATSKELNIKNVSFKFSEEKSVEGINLECNSISKREVKEESSTLICTDVKECVSVTTDQIISESVPYKIPKKTSVEVYPSSETYSSTSETNSNNLSAHSEKCSINKGLNLPEHSEINSDIIAVLNDAEGSVDADNDVFTENSENNQTSENYSPYYIANFKHILNNVLHDEYNKVLFNEEDMHFVNAFEGLSDSAQKLYVRLFQRKYNWLKLSKINYPNISKDPHKVLEELVSAGLVDSGLDMIDLETALDLLSLPEARSVAKQFNFNSSGKNKADICNMLLRHCKEHKSVFFCNGRNSVLNAMLRKVKQMLGHCFRVSLLPKRLFTRILMLFSLPTMSEDDDDAAGGQQQQLLTLLQVNKGEITFPDYKINRQTMIFIERDELIRYEEAKQLENDIMNAVENKKFDLAKELFIEAKEEFENQLFSPFVERSASLPSFLKKFTSFHIYVRCMTQGVEILQRLRQYKEAVDLLRRLLDQKVFCQDYRGRWLDRLALNLEQHLKQKQQALEVIKKGIKDKNIRVGYRYSLLTRALRILKSVDEKDELKNEILEAASVIEAPKVLIRGRLFPRNVLGRRNVFISSSTAVSDEDDITVLGVEQLAIEHYKSEGYTEGIHGEGSTFHFMYGLLFWDIIYDGEIPDAFISPYQTHPLDLNHDSFFARREKQIMNHLETLRASTIEELKEIIKSSWEAHFGQTSIVVWDRFTDLDHALGLVGCMGNNLLCGICERLARDFRFTRSGVPDLVVWNPETLQVKIVEVKGPSDKLSSKQILWLDYLLKLGAEAEVCHIEAVGSKKLRKE